MKTILFQGDSITDAGRNRGDDSYMGFGYANMVKGAIGFEYPGQFQFHNRGISGDRIVDVYARIKSDIINLKPDIMSLLIGVNDVWHELGGKNGVDAEKYFKIYSMLIEEVKEALPDIQIIIMGPFALKGTGNESYWEEFHQEVNKRAEKAKIIAEKYNLPYVSLQDKFEEATKLAPSDFWLMDGVHPHAAGHELIKREWIKAFKELYS